MKDQGMLDEGRLPSWALLVKAEGGVRHLLCGLKAKSVLDQLKSSVLLFGLDLSMKLNPLPFWEAGFFFKHGARSLCSILGKLLIEYFLVIPCRI